MGKKLIELTDLEFKALQADIHNDFFPPERSEEENKALHSAIAKMAKLEDDLDAYDAVDASGWSAEVWFWNMYQEQEGLDDYMQYRFRDNRKTTKEKWLKSQAKFREKNPDLCPVRDGK